MIGFDSEQMHWQEYFILVWVFTFLIEEIAKVSIVSIAFASGASLIVILGALGHWEADIDF
ncbi:hypothetical protein NL526_28040, partial [Klebsiella pneumoniae]|nr:hypothetical protein [Klebsiella pneumoniae]